MFPKAIEPLWGGLALALLAVSSVSAQEPSLTDLRERCEAARQVRIAPLREAAIEDCVARRRGTRSQEDCERINRDFGQGGANVGDGFRPRLFMDLPECVEMREAEDRQVRRRSSR